MTLRQRRFLPNLSLLLAFDAVMRAGSVTGAAQELGLTQSTISRLIQSNFIAHIHSLRPTAPAHEESQTVDT